MATFEDIAISPKFKHTPPNGENVPSNTCDHDSTEVRKLFAVGTEESETEESKVKRELEESEALARLLMAEEAAYSFELQYEMIRSDTAGMGKTIIRR